MTIAAKVIMDSISSYGVRLTTMQITLHRYVLAEFNTHRQFSRNFRSSRAVPVAKLLKEVRTNPAYPVVWQSNKPGMQGGELLSEEDIALCKAVWLKSAQDAADRAGELARLGLHKAWANRTLEPYLYVHGVVTSTEWANFYALRRHPDAQPEMKALADAMWEAKQASKPKLLQPGEWHLPYVLEEEIQAHGGLTDPTGILRKVSTARCARTSYLTHDNRTPNMGEDLALCQRLVGSVPLHASPAEHPATPDTFIPRYLDWMASDQWGNFYAWRQYRKTLENESIKDR